MLELTANQLDSKTKDELQEQFVFFICLYKLNTLFSPTSSSGGILRRKKSVMFSHSMLSALPWESNTPASFSHITRYAQVWEKPCRCVLLHPSLHIHMGENSVTNSPSTLKNNMPRRILRIYFDNVRRRPKVCPP